MGIKRTVCCDMCGVVQEEAKLDAGWPGWGAIQGVALDGVACPALCPECLAILMTFIEERKHDMD